MLGYRIVQATGHLIHSNGERRRLIPRHSPIQGVTMGAIPCDCQLNPQWFRDLLWAMDGIDAR
jgi:hypothetical protein